MIIVICIKKKLVSDQSLFIRRVSSCISAKKHTELSVSVDGGKWYANKLASLGDVASSSSAVDAIQQDHRWKPFPTNKIPTNFNAGTIYHHLIESVQFVDSATGETDRPYEDLHTAKPLKRGKQYYNSRNVSGMQDCVNNGNYCVKATVAPSMMSGQYIVHVVLSSQSGFVKNATCQCRASAMGRCSHVAAVLYAVLDNLENSVNDTAACTSKPCVWAQGKKNRKQPKKITDTDYLSKAPRKPSKLLKFDPRPAEFRNDLMSPEDINSFVTDMQTASVGLGSCMWEQLLPLRYSDYSLSDDETQILKMQCAMFENSLHISSKTPTEIVDVQRSDDWFHQRQFRINASKCHAIVTANSARRIGSLVNEQLWSSKHITTQAMMYGQEHEHNARCAFVTEMQKSSPGLVVTETGMWVNPEYPNIACSPDGIVHDPNVEQGDMTGLIEIKCPKVLENVHPINAKQHLSREQLQSFCLTDNGSGELMLKRNHCYYYQVQCQLGVTKLPWCYFVVWSKHGIFIEKIFADSVFWSNIKQKMLAVHREYFIPEYFEMRLPRKLDIIRLT